MKFDINDFYPKITEWLLEKALDFSNKYKIVTKHEKRIIYNSAKSILANQGDLWTNKSGNENNEIFDININSKHEIKSTSW